MLTIRGTKFGKTRLVPLHPIDLSRCLQTTSPDASAIGPGVQCPPMSSFPAGVIVWIAETFTELSMVCLARLGLRGASDRRGPRLHDMRHRFATNTLLQWYRSGEDPERRLPLLSAYLGHVHVADTQWYLEGCPEPNARSDETASTTLGGSTMKHLHQSGGAC